MLALSWRGALVAAAALGASGAIVACSSAGASLAAGFNPGGGYDAGADASTGSGDAGGDASGATRVPSALFVNASTSAVNLGAVRVCWRTSDGQVPKQRAFPSQIMPASNYEGIALGGAAFLRDATALAGGPITFDVIRAKTLARYGESDVTCDQLICAGGSDCLSQNTDYFELPPVSLSPDATSVVAIEGCLGGGLDTSANPARCGADWVNVNGMAAGNLHAQVLPVADSYAGKLAVQVAQLSPGLSALLGSGGSATLSLGTAAAPETAIATVGAEGQIAPSQPVALDLDASLPDYGQLGIRVDVGGVDAGAGDLFMTLAQAQQLVDPSVDPVTYYGAGGTYVVAVVGDPDVPHAFAASPDGGTYDGTGLHVLVVAAQPAP